MRRQRQRSIRTLLSAIFIVPLASLLALWGFAASVTVSNAVKEHNFRQANALYGGPAQGVGGQLDLERQLVYTWLSSGRRMSDQPLLAQFRATGIAAAAFEKGLNADRSIVPADAWPSLRSFESALNTTLPGVEKQVLAGQLSPLAAFAAYNGIVQAQFATLGDLIAVDNATLYQQASASIEAGEALDMANRGVDLIGGAFAAGGMMTKEQKLLLASDVASQRLMMSQALSQLQPSLDSDYRSVTTSATAQQFAAMENAVINSIGAKGPIPVSPQAFSATTTALFRSYQVAEMQDRLALTKQGTNVGGQLLVEVGLAGGLGLLAVVLSVFLAVWFGRRISRELRGLQHAALDLAEDRLPRVVDRLSRGEEVDVATEAAPIPPGRIAETARVADAFSTVQRTAVETAVGQARLRRGVSQVFRNLAWRSQSLLHRQLALLDTMERRQTEPETLDELFQLDHLTTRMRRHAEGLIILSGAAPGRGWRDPVPVMDVLRGAIAEVEDYKRVSVLCDSQDAIIGSAVADVIHLLAELIENATTYSPASTEVTIRAERVANGFVAEIEDRGIGIGPHELAAFNARLSDPPEFDIADSNQLGLFVVARLAGKHHISVTLRRSPYGGTTAIVLLPHPIVAMSERPSVEPFDVFRAELPKRGMPGTRAAENGLGRQQALPAGRLAPYDQAEEPTAYDLPAVPASAAAQEPEQPPVFTPASPVQEAGSPAAQAPQEAQVAAFPPAQVSPLPSAHAGNGGGSWWAQSRLPRRERQASLAPQLKTDGPAVPEEADANGAAGPSPAGSRALVESLQYALDRARATPTPPDDPWPAADPWAPADSWPSGPWAQADSRPAADASPPADKQDLASAPEDPEAS
ncbi:MAG TPA: nitrate- and nitrite sensing domain-containing protein [Streptosporangiaceae bacterium]|nr:nitrate- and nitrite sensing domain-containing protein [Streptosporangiaceae bacterium]